MTETENAIKRLRHEVWAQLFLCEKDTMRLREFLIDRFGVRSRHIVGRMHITVYHARRLMTGLQPTVESARIVVPASETRFMVMAPGGENPRPNLIPGQRKVGIRVQRKSVAMSLILGLRERLLLHETRAVLGVRRPSTHRTNAFGARSFQPHMTLLRAGSGVQPDLTTLGTPFREHVGDLTFDRFEIEVVSRE
jgi:hypothetical protein